MEAHPAASLFPMMSDAELQSLAADIKENGLRQSILTLEEAGVTYILDGRNRFRGCTLAGVLPTFVAFGGDDPFALVVSANLQRRHMTPSQRAMVASKMATLKHGGDRTSKASAEALSIVASQDDAAKVLNVSRSSVQRARVVEVNGVPELADAVATGSVLVTTAYRIANLSPDEQRLHLAAGTSPGTSLVRPSEARAHPNRNNDGHAAVRDGHAAGLTVVDIVEKTGLKKSFVAKAMSKVRKPTSVLAGATQDAEVFAESWASRVDNFDLRWATAPKEERDVLIEALMACRTAATKIINRLKKEAGERSVDEIFENQAR